MEHKTIKQILNKYIWKRMTASINLLGLPYPQLNALKKGKKMSDLS